MSLPQLMTRNRAADSVGSYSRLLFEGRMCIPTGAMTTIAAATSSAGHIFAARWVPATTGALCAVRYLRFDAVETTAFTTPQAYGVDLIVARGYSVSDTGGTAVDMGSTVANTNSARTATGTSLFPANACRVAGAGALTAGTHTLDANSWAMGQTFIGAVGQSSGLASFVLLDARDDGGGAQVRTPITLATSEGIKLRNTVLMGAAGVVTGLITMEWEEYLP